MSFQASEQESEKEAKVVRETKSGETKSFLAFIQT
jgi:hypothetical protein